MGAGTGADDLGDAKVGPHTPYRWPHLADVLWLSFLALYLTPWITPAPPSSNAMASVVGTAAFLAIYIHSYRARPTWLLPHVATTAAIGFVLACFGGVWNVFNVLAASIAARLQPRRAALTTLLALQLCLAAFGLWTRAPPAAWVSGLYFSVLAAGTTLLLADLDRRNRELQAAQGEIRRLGATAERERIARDLHDLLGRSLTAIALKASLARRLVRRDPARAEAEVGEVADAAREALAEVRTAVTGMAAPGLASELEQSRAALETAGVRAIIDVAGLPGEPRQDAALAMVLREAATNVVRHSGARVCTIRCGPAGGGYRLAVADDGRGGVVEGFGLMGMRRRIVEVGGRLDVTGAATGAQIVVWLPGDMPP